MFLCIGYKASVNMIIETFVLWTVWLIYGFDQMSLLSDGLSVSFEVLILIFSCYFIHIGC